jgi:hypothetical protein
MKEGEVYTMTTVAGVFDSPERAQSAAAALRQTGIPRINLLLPGATESQVAKVAVSDGEQPGMGAAVGGLVGGAIGAAGGLGLGTAAATLLVPGVGPVLALGIAAAAVFGAGGAVGGAAAGAAFEEESNVGIPADELYVYKDALRRGKSVLFVLAKDADEAERASAGLSAGGAESIDAARDQHWIGLRSAEREHYQALGGDFDRNERAYRRGFEAALRAVPGEAGAAPRRSGGHAFRCGYERGLAYRRSQRQ